MLALILFSLFKRVCLWVVKFGQWRKKWTIDSISFPQLQKGSTESWKLCLNLCYFKWLKPILRRVRRFSPNGLFMLKSLLTFKWFNNQGFMLQLTITQKILNLMDILMIVPYSMNLITQFKAYAWQTVGHT